MAGSRRALGARVLRLDPGGETLGIQLAGREDELAALMATADKGIRELVALQKQALGDFEPKTS